MINLTFDYWSLFERGQEARRQVDAGAPLNVAIKACDQKLIGSEAQAWEDGFERPDFQRNSHAPSHHEAVA